MDAKKTLIVPLSVLLFSGTVFSAPENKADKAADAIIMTTWNRGPVMSAIELEIRQLDNNSVVEKTKKHSTVLALAPGNYMATAKMNNIVRNRTFSVIDHTPVNVVIAMDE